MLPEQKIYGRWEFYLKDTTLEEVWAFYRPGKVLREDGVQIGGIGCAGNLMRNTAILMTYDEHSELMLRLKFFGNDKVDHHSFIDI